MNEPTHSEAEVKKKTRIGAKIAVIGFSAFILIMFAFHFIQPDLNPLTRVGSEYAVGRLGWIMNLAFFGFSMGLFSLAYAFNNELNPPAKSYAGEILLTLAGVGVLISGIFDVNLQEQPVDLEAKIHHIAGLFTFLMLIPAMFLLSRRLRLAGRLKGKYRYLPHLSWVIALLFLSMLFVFAPLKIVGLGQRIFIAAIFSWLVLASRGIQIGTFKSDS